MVVFVFSHIIRFYCLPGAPEMFQVPLSTFAEFSGDVWCGSAWVCGGSAWLPSRVAPAGTLGQFSQVVQTYETFEILHFADAQPKLTHDFGLDLISC